MLRTTLLTAAAMILSVGLTKAQAVKIGMIDNDGQSSLLIDESQGKEIISQYAAIDGLPGINVTEVLLSEMSLGQICLTGYEAAPDGKIVKGFRIECSQDDENNLIVKKGNKTEIVTGKHF